MYGSRAATGHATDVRVGIWKTAQTREDMQHLLLRLWEKMSHTIVFVTHDVSEAVTLADRILIMGKDPGCIREDIDVKLPRPRKKGESEFLLFCRNIYQPP